jgi:predicted protein tyrosine phosphatase
MNLDSTAGSQGLVPALRRLATAPMRRLRALHEARRPMPGYYRVDRVAPWLLIGPALLPEDYNRIAERGVTHVLDLRAERFDDIGAIRALGIHWRNVAVHDRLAPTVDQLHELLDWIDDEVRPDGVLYMHCEGGLGRTPTVAIALLLQQGYTLPEAHRMVLAARPEISPTGAQRNWITEAAEILPRRNLRSVQLRDA